MRVDAAHIHSACCMKSAGSVPILRWFPTHCRDASRRIVANACAQRRASLGDGAAGDHCRSCCTSLSGRCAELVCCCCANSEEGLPWVVALLAIAVVLYLSLLLYIFFWPLRPGAPPFAPPPPEFFAVLASGSSTGSEGSGTAISTLPDSAPEQVRQS